MTKLDLIVLGGGPAGAASAFTAARAGLRVALVDRSAFPRDKLCGGGVTGRAIGALGRVFGDKGQVFAGRDVRRVRLVAGDRLLGEADHATGFRMVMRRDFDAGLVAQAIAAGAQDFTGCRVADVAPAGPQLRLENGTTLTARALIGADGANSAVARALFGRAFDPDQIGFAMEAEAPDTPENIAEIDFEAARWGYGWAFPKTGGLTLGVGGRHKLNADMKARLGQYLIRHGASLETLRCKGAFIPMGETRDQPGHGATLLAGDAAGLVDPVTGEGIAWAIDSGAMAARAVMQALGDGAPTTALRLYAQALRPVAAELRSARRIAAAVHHPWLHARFLRSIEGRPRPMGRFMQLLSGELDYADLGWGSLARVVLRRGQS